MQQHAKKPRPVTQADVDAINDANVLLGRGRPATMQSVALAWRTETDRTAAALEREESAPAARAPLRLVAPAAELPGEKRYEDFSPDELARMRQKDGGEEQYQKLRREAGK